eukprot:jgi/Mesen1/652/ME000109S10865
MSILAEEYYGHGGGQRTAVWIQDKGSSITFIREETRGSGSFLRNLRSAFLPEGYPLSVTDDYLPFQMWDTLQGSNLDSNAKQWRLAADLINDVGMLLDLVSPLLGRGAFLPLLCLGSIFRAITGTASGATRAALTQHFAVRQNAADISAKEGSQETAATMVGMLLGLFVGRATASRPVALWACFLALTAFHMYANYRAVRSLCLSSVNGERLALLLRHFQSHGSVLSSRQVSPLERVLPLPSWLHTTEGGPSSSSIVFGARLASLQLAEGWQGLARLKQRCGAEKYMLVPRGQAVHVVLHRYATSADMLHAYCHALLVAEALRGTGGQLGGPDAAELAAKEWLTNRYPDFLGKLAQAGWETGRVLLAPGDWRADWSPPSAHGQSDGKPGRPDETKEQ